MVGPGGRSSLMLKCLLEFIAFLATIEKTKQSNNQQIILDKKKTVTGILILYKYDVRKHLIMQFTAELLICGQVFQFEKNHCLERTKHTIFRIFRATHIT